MKTFSLLLTVMIAAAISQSAFAQKNDQNTLKTIASKTESFKVFGNCELCQTRIETAVKEEGASSASWDRIPKCLRSLIILQKPVMISSVKSSPPWVMTLKSIRPRLMCMTSCLPAVIMREPNKSSIRIIHFTHV